MLISYQTYKKCYIVSKHKVNLNANKIKTLIAASLQCFDFFASFRYFCLFVFITTSWNADFFLGNFVYKNSNLAAILSNDI